ncbi:hypothetical protein CSAL01_05771 [Colletotrichum salicis]|uniref:Uncharacterized protein n=1 Tax=Colletotrichum salicis TaxID=1209931 RepID=A0A135V470_9PEZI|nr:hypothetical protein CSAL01_05771 [Colletotrichum salicis]
MAKVPRLSATKPTAATVVGKRAEARSAAAASATSGTGPARNGYSLRRWLRDADDPWTPCGVFETGGGDDDGGGEVAGVAAAVATAAPEKHPGIYLVHFVSVPDVLSLRLASTNITILFTLNMKCGIRMMLHLGTCRPVPPYSRLTPSLRQRTETERNAP